eukprot:COSAG02_NODE_233_length_27847_cov_20.383055_20_plen_240_part_00
MQSLVLQQLTGAVFTGDEPDSQRKQSLQLAMQKKRLLLVLDDCWDPEQEKLLNFIDEDSGGKVLLSSRVHQVIQSSSSMRTELVTIGLPTEAEAVEMLLSTAGLSADGDVPPQTRELVQFCKLLPLSISIAGKLVQDIGLGLEVDEWEGIVDMMREESADKERTVEESVICASLNSIRGPQRENVLHMFKALALLPEDAVVPPLILAIMFEAVPKLDGTFRKRPNVLTTRRLIKQLIDR